jgi:uncharacterized lipoprotein YajG
MKKMLLLVAFVALVFVSACARSVNVALLPDFKAEIQKGNELSKVTPALRFFKGGFTDKRQDVTVLTRFKQGTITYNLHEERPMADVLFEGLLVALTASNHKWDDGTVGEVKVNVTFINLQAVRNAGFIKVGATSSIQIKVDFVDAKAGTLIFSNVYSGTDERDQAMFGTMGMVKSSIDASIVRCIQSVTDDAELAAALGKLSR